MEQRDTEKARTSKKDKQGRCYILPLAIFLAILLVILLVVFLVVLKDDDDDDSENHDNNNINKDYIIIETKLGKIQGKVHNVVKDDNSSATVYEYRNIPYAVPPVGDLRWRPPIALNSSTSWKGVLNYTTQQIWCKQNMAFRRILGTEDCLILTIRQPSHASKSNRLPVLFWVHGGGLVMGSSYWYYPAEECTASLGMVTVSINYRLNVFGFLSIKEMWTSNGTKEYGNFGIMDIIQALKWVKENIENFGGDPTKVTVLGQSGGGAALYSLIASPVAKDLFQKVIATSGFPVSPLEDYHYADKRYADTYKSDTKCNKSTSYEVMRCLRNLRSDELIENFTPFKYPLNPLRFSYWIFPFNEPVNSYPARVIDGKIIMEPIWQLSKIPTLGLQILLGNTAAEGDPVPQAATWEGFFQYLKPRINSFTKNLLNTTLLPLYQERRSDKTSPRNMTPQYIHQMMLSDVLLSCQTNGVVKNLSAIPNVKVYRYVASQPFSYNPWNLHPPSAYHGIDTDALFGFKYQHRHVQNPLFNPTTDDLKLVRSMRQLVKDFVFNDVTFEEKYKNATIDLWDDQIIALDAPYHHKECQVLRDNGFLRRSWGQLNM